MNANCLSSKFLFLCCILALIAADSQGKLPQHKQDDLNDRLEKHSKECRTAKVTLLKAFNQRISMINQNRRLNPEDRVALVRALEVEKRSFETRGHVPFSPIMRTAMQAYVAKISTSGRRLTKAYDVAIAAQLAEKNANGAAELLQRKHDVPRVMGTWECEGANFRRGEKFTWTLYSDFTVNRFQNAEGEHPKFWSFLGNKIVITNIGPTAPKGGFKDVCTIHHTGQRLDARNQFGGIYVGERIE